MKKNFTKAALIIRSAFFWVFIIAILSGSDAWSQGKGPKGPDRNKYKEKHKLKKRKAKDKITSKQLKNAKFNFKASLLKGSKNGRLAVTASLKNPTSLQFGPDGKLYIAQQNGLVKIFTIAKNGPNDYTITSQETITLINEIPNHNDDGSLAPGVITRQITSLLVTGTAATPVLYVSSSDSRIGGPSGDLNLDTNSGIISKLTKTATGWDKVDLVRGLPRSEENHSTNGMQIDGTKLYIAIGGFTNAGSPSTNFAYTPEYALSAAILSVDLAAIEALPVQGSGNNKYKYDLPTLDDPTRPGNPDAGDPFGGNDGLNQAKIVPGGPVQVFASGFRNAFDLVITKARRMYIIDNGANPGWGGHPDNEGGGNVTNNYVSGEPGSTGPGPNDPKVNNLDNLHYVGDLNTYVPGSFYGGHPNPTRANPAGAGLYTHANGVGVWRTSTSGPNPLPADWPPLPVSMAHPIEGNYQNPGVPDNSLLTFRYSTNGIAEYTASNFNNDLKGHLLAASFDGTIQNITLNAAGTDVTNLRDNQRINKDLPFASNFGSQPLDIVAQGDNDIFPGTVWVVCYLANSIFIFEPQSSPGECVAAYSTVFDDDGDGYSNADEIDNSSNPCSSASRPSDADGDLLSDLNDPDDDNDALADDVDYFPLDFNNGLTTNLPIEYDLLNNDPGTGLFGLGFTGLMLPKLTGINYQDLFDDENLIAGGAVGAFSVESTSTGDAYQALNNQENGFQFGVNVNSSTGPFTAQTRLLGPFFNNQTPQYWQALGLFIGTGDQDNYIKIVLGADGAAGGVEVLYENNGIASSTNFTLPGGLPASTMDLYLSVDPLTGKVQPKYAKDNGQVINLGPAIQVSGPLLDAIQGAPALAVGIISTSLGSTPFTATWDLIRVTKDLVTNTEPVLASIGSQTVTLGQSLTFTAQATDTDVPAQTLSYSVTGPASASINASTGAFSWTPTTTGTFSFTVRVTDNGAPALSDQEVVTVTVNPPGSPPMRLNAGGPAFVAGDGRQFVADTYFSGGNTAAVPAATEIDNTTDDALYRTERYGNFAYDIPVSNGYYNVILHFAETYSGVINGTTTRKFNVDLEGLRRLTEYDITQQAGGTLRAHQQTLGVPVSDGTLNVVFSQGSSQNPKISAIEIVATTPPANQAPILVTAIADQTATVGQSFSVAFGATAFTDLDGDVLTYTASLDNNTALPAWLSFSNSTRTFSGIPPVGSPASITVKVTANDGKGGSVSDSFVISITTGPPPMRLNAGGPAFVAGDGRQFVADTYFSGGNTAAVSAATAIDNTTDDALYRSERYGNFAYNIPVSNGYYNVILHFAETYGQVINGTTTRKFNVDVEGLRRLTEYDIAQQAGGTLRAHQQTLGVPVSDGTLNVVFSQGSSQNPKISAIEIVATTPPANQAPILVTAIADQTATVGQSFSVAFGATAFTDLDGDVLTYTASLDNNTALPAWLTFTASTRTFSGIPPVGSPASITVKVTANDGKGGSASDSFVVSIMAGPPPLRLNAGGPAFVAGDGRQFVADIYFSGGNTATVPTATEIDNTTDDALYRTERYGNFAYDIPVSNGYYNVILHFAETYSGVINGTTTRKFNVDLEGLRRLNEYDIAQQAGGTLRAHQQTLGVPVSDGTLNLVFSQGSSQSPKVSAIEIVAATPPANHAPVLVTAIADQNATVGQSFSVAFGATAFGDVDGDVLTYTASLDNNTALPAWLTFTASTRTFSGIPPVGSPASITVKVTANDSKGGSVSDSFVISIAPPLINQPPVLAAIGSQTATLGQSLTFTAQATDTDVPAQNLSYSVTGNATASINSATGAFSWTPTTTGTFSFTVRVTDNGAPALSDQEVVTVMVTPPGIRLNAGGPTFVAGDGRQFVADTYFSGGNTATVPTATEIDNTTDDALYRTERYGNFAYDIPVSNGYYNVILHFAETYGQVINGTVTRKFNVDVEGLRRLTEYDIAQQAGGTLRAHQQTLGVPVSDGTLNVVFSQGSSQSPKVSAIEIVATTPPANQAPILITALADQTATVGQSFSVAFGETAFTDVDGDVLTYTASLDNNTALPAWLSFSNSTRTFSGIPPVGSPASITVKVTASDTQGGSANDSFVINISIPVVPSTWEIITPTSGQPTARQEGAYVQAGDRFYLIGGRGIKPVQVYDPIARTWINAASTPINMHHFQAVTMEGLIYVVGALTDNYPSEPPIPQIYIYDPKGNKWFPGPEIPANRRRGASGIVIYNNKIYMAGGITNGHSGGYVDWFDEFDPATNSWRVLPNAPRTRDHFQAVTIGDKLYAAGGRRTSHNTNETFTLTVPEVDVYNFTTGQWSTLPTLIPTPRAGSTAVVLDGELVIIGGESSQPTAHNETEALNVVTNGWQRLANLQQGRHGTQAISNNGSIYITAGSGGQGGSPVLSSQELFYKTNPTTPTGTPLMQSTLTAPANTTLGQVITNSTKSGLITVTNSDGNQALLISSIALTGSNEFTFQSPFALPFILPVGQSVNINVNFNPASVGSKTSTLAISHSGSGGSTSVSLSGEAISGIPPANHTPALITALVDQTAAVGQSLSLAFEETAFGDVDGDVLTYTASLEDNTALPAWLSFSNSTRTFSGIPPVGSPASLTVKVIASDGKGGVVSDSFVITITPAVNQPPALITALADQTATVGQSFSVAFGETAFTDPDGDVLTYTASLEDNTALPAWLTFVGSTRTFSGIPPVGSPASLTVKVTASDGRGGVVSDSFVITITTPVVNQPPALATIGNRTLTLGQSLTFTAQATDTDVPAQTLTYSVTGPASASINASTGAFSWTPTTTGTFSFTVKVTDNGTPALSDQKTISVTVNPAVAPQQAVVSFSLMNATSNLEIKVLTAGEVLNLATLPTRNLNIRVNTNPVVVGSVVMVLSGKQKRTQTETGAPYALFGDTNGDYNAWTPTVGDYSLKVTPYTNAGGAGTAGIALTQSFKVIDQAPVANARLSASENSDLQVVLLGNPIVHDVIEVEVRGAAGWPLQLQLMDIMGNVVVERQIQEAGSLEKQRLSVAGQAAGVLVLRVSTPSQSRTLKVIKP